MNKITWKLLGILVLVIIWKFPLKPEYLGVNTILFSIFYIILLLGISYSIYNKEGYPIKAVVSSLIAFFIIHQTKSRAHAFAPQVMYLFNLYVGTVLVLGGQFTVKTFRFILSPVKNYINNLGLTIPIPIIANILLIPFEMIFVELSFYVIRFYIRIN